MVMKAGRLAEMINLMTSYNISPVKLMTVHPLADRNASSFLIDSIAALAAAVLLFLCVLPKKRLGRLGGFLMLVGYAAYFAYIL